jgi:hypothetical protein
MQNEWIDDLTTNHSFAPLLEQKQMRILNAKKMEPSSKINLKDVSWWKSIKDACKLRVPIIAKFSKEGCISLVTKGKSSCTTHKHD